MARGRRRLGISLLVLVVVLGGLLVAADRAGAWAAERTLTEKVSNEIREMKISSAEPEVGVGGFPFLTQVVDGNYEDIHIVLRDVSRGGLVLPELDVHARDVKAELNTLMSGEGEVVARRIVGTATIGYASIRALFDQPGIQLSEQGGKLRLRLPVDISGQQLTAVATGQITSAGGRVRLAVTDIRAEGLTLGSEAQALLDQYKRRLALEIALPPLPFRLRVEGVQVRPEGLAVTASAQQVPLSGQATLPGQ
ncbi:MAG TPA: DUF2993 domain-containing protein [Micromonosporaceae bacterium]|nr:DUF2993 domain-containing protein [Micromonosporaceae bacterium]